MLEDYRILTQQIKLKNLIIACFIPPDYQDKIMQHCHWQDYDGSWNIDCISYAGAWTRVCTLPDANKLRTPWAAWCRS